MKSTAFVYLFACTGVVWTAPVLAQLVPDARTETVVTPNSLRGVEIEQVNGGKTSGSNLFHSFESFNIPNGQAVYFANPLGITNILTRITGKAPSQIDGTLGVLGNANLFLMNPNGLIFGANARLDLRGSFVGTTADAIGFGDGLQYSASQPSSNELLSISAPVGLNFNGSGAGIAVQNVGHRFVQPKTQGLPNVDLAPAVTGLTVNPNRTLALIGGDVNLTGGILTAPSGRIELAGVQSGKVKIASDSLGLAFDYNGVNTSRDIQLSRLALANTSGSGNSAINLTGRNITLTDKALVLNTHAGLAPAGEIRVTGNTLTVIGDTANTPQLPLTSPAFTSGGIVSQVTSSEGADVRIAVNQLNLQDAAGITSLNVGTGQGGDITIDAAQSIRMTDTRTINTSSPSSNVIFAGTLGPGSAGDIAVRTRSLEINDGGLISSTAFNGAGGNVRIDADSIRLIGFAPVSTLRSGISSLTVGTGNAGDLTINTQNLSVLNGGGIDVSSVSAGNAGNLTINATGSIVVSGTTPITGKPSFILAVSDPPTAIAAQTLPPASGVGDSGAIAINANRLIVQNGALVSVRNTRVGNAGSLRVRADQVVVDRATVSAATTNGNGGNLDIEAGRALILRRNAFLSATSSQFGTGGNITIRSPIVVAIENSSISANANRGFGGRINISAIGLLRSQDSTISASSNQGEPFNGTININQVQSNPVETTPEVSPPTADLRVAVACAGQSGTPASFVISGRGGTAAPTNLSGQRGWIDPTSRNSSIESPRSEEIAEAQGAVVLPSGEIAFVVDPANPSATRADLSPCQKS